MIRINLLKTPAAAPVAAPQDQEAPLKPSGSSTFISRREVALGGLFLLLGGAILATQVFDVFEDPALVEQMSGEAPPKEIAVQMSAPEREPDQGLEAAVAPLEEPPPSAVAAEVSENAGESEAPANQPAVDERTPDAPLPSSAEPKPSPQRKSPAKPAPAAGAPSPKAGRFAIAEGAVPVRDIQIVPWGESAEVFISVSGAQYSTFRLASPPRLVVDIENAMLSVPSNKRNMSVDHAAIRQIRSAQNSFDPALVRVVIETDVSDAEVTATANGISVKLGAQQ